MSLHEKIAELIDEEVDQRLVGMMNEYVEIISKKHGISMDLLLKDIPKTFSGTICKGTKRNDGKRCTFRATDNGYCRHHSMQGNRLMCTSLVRSNSHNHGPERGFVENCPGCELSKELIDLGTMIGNE
jgi:hypothetical protein